jgi:hypothetical protein
MRSISLIFAFSAALATACSAAPGGEPSSRTSAPASGTAFFSVAPGSQGGFDLTSLNMLFETHVASIDYSGAGLDASTITSLQALPSTELVLAGVVTGSTLAVSTAYEGMPGMTFDASATFYQASGTTAFALNDSESGIFTTIDVTAAAAPLVQQSWLANQVASGALVAGQVTQGKVLAASQVFLALPYAPSPCTISSHVCAAATPLDTYTRDTNLCIDFAGCEAQGICPDFIPECWAGYTRTSWPGTQGACMQYACDPSFVTGG